MSPLTLAFLPLLILTVATGYGLARRRFNALRLPWKPSGVENAVIGVYALLLSFAFYMSGNASRETTTLVHEHSDALAMLYREAALLPERDAEAVRDHVQRILALEVRSMALDGDARRSVGPR
jgi:hypothetical protein